MAVLTAEPDAPLYTAVLEGSDPLLMSAGTLLEVGTAVLHRGGRDLISDLFDLLDVAQIEIIPVTEAHARDAIAAYARLGKWTRHPAQLNFGDCFAYALAKAHDEALLYKGNDLSETDVRSAL